MTICSVTTKQEMLILHGHRFNDLRLFSRKAITRKNPNRLHEALLVLTPLTAGAGKRSGANTTGKRLSSFVVVLTAMSFRMVRYKDMMTSCHPLD